MQDLQMKGFVDGARQLRLTTSMQRTLGAMQLTFSGKILGENPPATPWYIP
jgi:hypothetical protein